MNRIYQGRVTKVEMPKQGVAAELKDWKIVLWQHHELFQDAVNYYLIALLSLARDSTNPVTLIRKRMDDPTSEHQIWTSFRRCGQTRRGMRDSVAKYLSPGKSEPTLEECFVAVLDGNKESPDVLDLALQELLNECDGDGAIQQEGRSMLPRFCSPSYSGDYPNSAAAKAKKSAKEWLPAFLYSEEGASSINIVRERLNFDLFANRDLTGRVLDAVESRKRLNEMLGWLAERHPSLASELERLQKIIAALPESFNLPAWRGGSINKEALQRRFYAWLIFEYVEASRITFDILRDSFPEPKEKRKSVGETTPLEKPSSELSDDPIKIARGARGYVFRAFTSLPCWGADNPKLMAWKEFDVAAFKEALKALHQIESKGKEREKERTRLLQRHAFMRGETKTWKASPELEETEPGVLAGDPRIERLETLLKTELADEYEMSEGQTLEYGLQPRTIRGFRDLRKEWNKIVKAGEQFSEQKKENLVTSLRNYQNENPNVIGSVRLYEALLEVDNWLIWQQPDSATAERWAKQKFASDPLEALTEERQLLRDVERLKQPIRFTPVDAVHSRRQFYFSDMTDLSVKNRFDTKQQIIEVPIAIKNNAHWKQQFVKIHFSAPRIVRDQLIDAAIDESQARWQQPMMEALGLSLKLTKKDTGISLSECTAVALMPEELASGDRRILLNFPITLETAPIVKALGKASLWDGQFVSYGEDNFYLRWPKDNYKWPAEKEANAWYRRLSEFSLLSVDLGQRDAGAIAVIRASNGTPTHPVSRFVGEAIGQSWYATVSATGLLRLPGENAKVFRSGQRQEELYGERGRRADEPEWTEARKICETLGLKPDEIVGDDPQWFSFPELNDRLLFAVRRAQTRLARLQSWSWMIIDESLREKIREAILSADDELSLKAAAEKFLWPVLAEKIATEVNRLRDLIPRQLVILANRILPLRGRRWEWVKRDDSSGCHVLRKADPGTDTTSKKVCGQRGLSMKRLEQLEELRRRFQSLNRALLQTPGQPAGLGKSKRGIELPDPCPDLLDKTEQLREQRVNQTAHLILAEALGVRLRAPQKKRALRTQHNIHGEYEAFRPPVDFIVLEDLSRYLSSQGRARNENSRLMKWCHRAILLKLKQLCEPYGLKILETNAAYSSRFCSRTGVAGFRAVELTPDARKEFRWRKHLDRLEKAARGEIKLDREARVECEHVKRLLEMLDHLNAGRKEAVKPIRTLLAPITGGPIFIPMQGHTTQADINAAINLGLRAIAAPDCHAIHVRIRTERKDKSLRVRTGSNREKVRWEGKNPDVQMNNPADLAGLNGDRQLNFFPDPSSIASYDRANIANIELPFASGRGLWGTINELQWMRVNQLNNDRAERRWNFTKSRSEQTLE